MLLKAHHVSVDLTAATLTYLAPAIVVIVNRLQRWTRVTASSHIQYVT